jgi:hypothetical protein
MPREKSVLLKLRQADHRENLACVDVLDHGYPPHPELLCGCLQISGDLPLQMVIDREIDAVAGHRWPGAENPDR